MVTENQNAAPTQAYESMPLVMSIKQVAALFGTSYNGIAEQIRRGNLKAFNILPGGRPKYRIMRDDLIAWMTQNPVKSTATEVK